MLRLMLLALLFVGCITNTETKSIEVIKRDTLTVTRTDTIYLVDRPKDVGEPDPPKLIGADYRPNSAGFAFDLILHLDTVPNAAGYRMYYSYKETSAYSLLSTQPYEKSGASLPSISDAILACACNSLNLGGNIVYIRATTISKLGKESKLSDFLVVLTD